MIAGGNDTAAGLIVGSAELLTAHRDQRQILLDDPSSVPGAVDELLRLTTPVQGLCRVTETQVAIDDVVIPPDSRVMLCYGAANRDPREFGPDSERLDVSRKVGRQVAFGSGVHHCLGAYAGAVAGSCGDRGAAEGVPRLLGGCKCGSVRRRGLRPALRLATLLCRGPVTMHRVTMHRTASTANDPELDPALFLPDPEPREVRTTIISVDDHVVEPIDTFEGRIPAKLADRAPRIVETPEGHQVWEFEGQQFTQVGMNAVAGRRPETFGLEPFRFDQMRAGCYDVDARVRDMDLNGVWASVNFPSQITGFCGRVFFMADDPDLGMACIRGGTTGCSRPGTFATPSASCP